MIRPEVAVAGEKWLYMIFSMHDGFRFVYESHASKDMADR
jgi:hypothetical protein